MFDDKDPDASATSDELSDASETYDFLNVYMPLIRPKEPDSDEEELKEAKPKKGAKGKKGLKKQAKSFAMTKPSNNNLAEIADGGVELIRRASSMDTNEPQVIQLGQLGSADDD